MRKQNTFYLLIATLILLRRRNKDAVPLQFFIVSHLELYAFSMKFCLNFWNIIKRTRNPGPFNCFENRYYISYHIKTNTYATYIFYATNDTACIFSSFAPRLAKHKNLDYKFCAANSINSHMKRQKDTDRNTMK